VGEPSLALACGILDCHEDPSVIIGRQHRTAAKWCVTTERGVKSVFVATLHKQTGVAVTDRILEKITVSESSNARGKTAYDIPAGHVAAASDIDSSASDTIGVNNLIISHFGQCSPTKKIPSKLSVNLRSLTMLPEFNFVPPK
jgi:hypothetical protein